MPESELKKKSKFQVFLYRLRERRILETLAAFIGGGWLILEFVHWILIDHYHFPERSLDITFVTLLGALLCTLLWRWFHGIRRRRKVKVEWILIPIVMLTVIFGDIYFLFNLGVNDVDAGLKEKEVHSIAVIPFRDFSPEKNLDYFCDGMTEDIIGKLANIKGLRTTSLTSMMRYRETKKDIREIGKELGVSTVLEGSIQKEGDNLRIAAQLINVKDGFHIWTKTYNRRLESYFQIQDEISRNIAGALEIRLIPASSFLLAVRSFQSGENELGFKHLEKAVDQKDEGLYTLETNPVFDKIRDDPRFLKILSDLQN